MMKTRTFASVISALFLLFGIAIAQVEIQTATVTISGTDYVIVGDDFEALTVECGTDLVLENTEIDISGDDSEYDSVELSWKLSPSENFTTLSLNGTAAWGLDEPVVLLEGATTEGVHLLELIITVLLGTDVQAEERASTNITVTCPAPTTTSAAILEETSDGGISPGGIVGIVLGAIVVLIVVIILIICFVKRESLEDEEKGIEMKGRKEDSDDSDDDEDDSEGSSDGDDSDDSDEEDSDDDDDDDDDDDSDDDEESSSDGSSESSS